MPQSEQNRCAECGCTADEHPVAIMSGRPGASKTCSWFRATPLQFAPVPATPPTASAPPEPRPPKPHVPWTPDPRFQRCEECGATDTSLTLTPEGKRVCQIRCGRFTEASAPPRAEGPEGLYCTDCGHHECVHGGGVCVAAGCQCRKFASPVSSAGGVAETVTLTQPEYDSICRDLGNMEDNVRTGADMSETRKYAHDAALFLGGMAFSEWRYHNEPWWVALGAWVATVLLSVAVYGGLTWLAAKRDTWFDRRRAALTRETP